MILVTIGTTEFQFTRFLEIIDKLCEENIINSSEVIAQIGDSKYQPKNYKNFNLIARDEFQNYLNKAELVITHAGTGSIMPALKKHKKVIVFPRLSKYNEHLDDHQLDLAQNFTNQGYTLKATNYKELRECIVNINKFEPKEFKSNNEKINDIIIDYINNN